MKTIIVTFIAAIKKEASRQEGQQHKQRVLTVWRRKGSLAFDHMLHQSHRKMGYLFKITIPVFREH